MSSSPPRQEVGISSQAPSLCLPRDGIFDKDKNRINDKVKDRIKYDKDKDRSPCTHCNAKKDGRNLILSFDGTSNQFGENNTNVIELYARIIKDDTQLTYYNSGIGTYARPSVASFRYWRQVLSNKVDLAIAWNFEKVILRGYRWLSDKYKPGDRIFLFGFSRGAYQVRALAGMISTVGLILPGNEEQIPFAFELYADLSKGCDDKHAKRFKKTFCRPDVRVHFLGAWDTVSSIGVVRRNPLRMTDEFNDDICYFRHALALDERRVKFLPEYVCGAESYIPPQESSKAEGDTRGHESHDNVKEVWFSGCHSDIGGGGQSNAELNNASVPVLWMGNEAIIAGLRLHPSNFEWNWDKLRDSKPKESLTLAWRLLEIFPFKRLSYTEKARYTWWPHLGGVRKIKPGQKVHASVAFIHDNYKPKATLQRSGAEIEWERILGKGNKDNVDWADGLQHLLEMDLFDYSNGAAITVGLAKNEIHNTFFTGRLQFMASFAQGAEAISDADPKLELVRKMLESDAEEVKDAGALLLCKVAVCGFKAMLDDLPKDKAKWITMDNNKLVFNILEPVVAQYALTRTSHRFDPSQSASDIYSTVCDAATFFKFCNCFNGVSASNSDLENKIQIEFMSLGSSGDVYGLFDTAINITPNLYRNGVVDIVIDKENTASDYYGLRVTNNTQSDLYLAVLSFDHIDFGVYDRTTYDVTPTGEFKIDQLLKANGGSQPVGYGSSAPRWCYILKYGQEVDVELLKLFFFPKEAADVLKAQPSLFFESDSDLRPYGTILIPVIQRLAKRN